MRAAIKNVKEVTYDKSDKKFRSTITANLGEVRELKMTKMV